MGDLYAASGIFKQFLLEKVTGVRGELVQLTRAEFIGWFIPDTHEDEKKQKGHNDSGAMDRSLLKCS